ncbi:unnamed protein product [Prunus armeniaca]|uniref:Uncharacterized protein n=1 Tax=Prunus armeniaca TaxID=36596 RepID=A0A6J5XFC7_PRUAR|nr:unnamed protein product [Prunus armeniaca]
MWNLYFSAVSSPPFASEEKKKPNQKRRVKKEEEENNKKPHPDRSVSRRSSKEIEMAGVGEAVGVSEADTMHCGGEGEGELRGGEEVGRTSRAIELG